MNKKYTIGLIAFILLLGVIFIFSQTATKIIKNKSSKLAEYTAHIIIEGKWGAEPGEFGMHMSEGEPSSPKSLVVDKLGNILILDVFNNRIQKFNKEGQYVDSISIESYRLSTKEEIDESKNTWNKLGFDFPTIYASELYIDQEDNLYLKQERNNAKTGQVDNKFFKYNETGQKMEIGQPEFDQIKERAQSQELSVKSENGEYLITLTEDKEKEKQYVRVNNLTTNQIRNIPFIPKYPATKIGFIKIDRDNNIYLFTAWPPQIHKYDLEGNLLSTVNLYGLSNPNTEYPTLHSTPYIDDSGNIYQMELIPSSDKQIEHFPAYSTGLRIIKWENGNK